MKILQVIHSLDPRAGGTTEAVRQLSQALDRLGVEVEAMCLDAPESPWLADFPLPVTALGPGRSTYGYTPRAIPWLREHGADYDLIIVNGLWQFGGWAVQQAARSTGVPYVVFPHGMLDPWFKRHYPLKHLKKWLYWPWGEYRVLRDAAAVYFTTEEERLEARKSFWLYRCQEEVSGFGIDPPPEDRARLKEIFLGQFPHLAGQRLLLFLGRMHEKKGCDLLLRAFHRTIAAKNISPAAHLVMAGPYDSNYGTAMIETTRKLRLESSVTWTGMLTGDLKWGALAAADAFVLPSHQENFGVSVVEALACGCPVLISNKVNIWREIQADEAGQIENDDLAGTERLLLSWAGWPAEESPKRRGKALACFKGHFLIDEVARNLLANFQSLLQPRRGKTHNSI